MTGRHDGWQRNTVNGMMAGRQTRCLVDRDTPLNQLNCVSVKGILYMLDLSDNFSIVSTFNVGSPIFSSICVDADSDASVVFGCHDHHVYCVDVKTASLNWKVEHSSPGMF